MSLSSDQIERLKVILKSKEKKYFIVHHNADVDAVAAAYVLYEISNPPRGLCAPLGISRLSRELMLRLNVNIEILDKVPIEKDAFYFIIDTNSLEQIGDFPFYDITDRIVIIDHHSENPEFNSALLYIHEERSATCEIVYDILKAIGFSPNEKMAQAMISGIITDTARFRYANNRTIKVVCDLLDYLKGVDLKDIIRSLEEPSLKYDRGKRIAMVKAFQRMLYEDLGKVIIVKSFISAYEGDAAALMVSTVADIAVVGAQRDEEARVSVRVRPWLAERGIDASEICRDVAEEFGGGGGGHSMAAGINAVGDAEAIVSAVVTRFKRKLKELRI